MDINLTDKASQSGFAELVNVSRQAIQKQCEKGNLKSGQTYHEWLIAYCDHLRAEASGRGGESAGDLTAARIAESHEKTLAMRYDRLQKENVLMLAEQVELVLSEVFTTVRGQVSNAETKVLEALRSQHNLDINDEFVREPFRAALASVAARAAELGQSLSEGDRSSGAEAA